MLFLTSTLSSSVDLGHATILLKSPVPPCYTGMGEPFFGVAAAGNDG